MVLFWHAGISVSEYRLAVDGERDLQFVCEPCQAARVPDVHADDTMEVAPDIDEVTVDDSADDTVETSDDDDSADNPTDDEPDAPSFRVDGSFQEPVVIHERSLEDDVLPDEMLPDGPVTYEVIEKGSQKGADLLVDSVGYSYNVKDRRARCVRWSCSVKNKRLRCSATVTQKGGTFKRGTTQHNHPPDPSRGITAKVTKKAKAIATQDLFRSAQSIVADARREETTDTVGIINAQYVARRANRKRAAMRPADPKDMDFVLDTDAIPDDFLRDDVEVDGRRHLLFSTGKQLGVLGRAARWYVDGTFKCMRAPFVMLLTIHAFVKMADCSKQVPLIFALMSGRKTSDYVAVFESVQKMLGSYQVEGMVIDYEKAIWKSVRRVFPGISLSGCAFHWGQAVWSHVQSLGLATAYSRNKATHSYIRKLLSLPFLPHEHIRPTFQQMREFNTSDALRPLLRYLERHWFGSSVWSVEEWCVFGQAVRTNNDVEGWHRGLNAKTGVAPPFYVLIGLLHKEALDIEETVHLVTELGLSRIQRKSYREMQGKLFRLWDLYARKEMSTSGLLKKVSIMYGHRVIAENV